MSKNKVNIAQLDAPVIALFLVIVFLVLVIVTVVVDGVVVDNIDISALVGSPPPPSL